MKIEKSNNPAAIGALVVVLVLIVGRIVSMLFGSKTAAASTVAAPPAVQAPIAAAPLAPASVRPQKTEALRSSPVTLTQPVPTRNPFTCAVSVRTTALLTKPRGTSGGHEAGHFSPLPPLPIRVRELESVGPEVPALPGLRVPAVHAGQGSPSQAGGKTVSEADPFQSLKLTAIVDGTQPMAVVQTSHPEPVVLHVGDELNGMRVVAINEQDMVFACGKSRRTLTMQSALTDGATGGVSVTPVEVPEEKTDE